MLKNNKGFSLLETMLSFSLFLIIMGLFIPACLTIRVEETILETRREMLQDLDSHLQEYLAQNTLTPLEMEQMINHSTSTITFTTDDSIIKACITWTNLRNQREVKCLNGRPL